MLLNMREKHYVQTGNHCHFIQPFVHYDRTMEVHDFIYLERGSWEIYQDDIPYLMMPGDVLCLEAGHHHYGKIPCSPDTRTIFVHVYHNAGDGIPSQDSVKLNTLIKAGDRNIKSDFERIVNIWWQDAPYRDFRSSALLELLICKLAQYTAQPVISDLWPLSVVHRMLINNPEINYSLAEIAAALEISERSLRYRFFQVAGKTIHQYQLDLKLRMAAQLILVEPWNSLADIAHTFGFYDQYHFSKAFKKRFGISPSTYRKTGSHMSSNPITLTTPGPSY